MKAEANNLLKIEELERRVAELEGWKASAMTVLGEWHDLTKSLPKEFLDRFLGQSESAAVKYYIAKLELSGISAFLEIRKAIGDLEGRLSQPEVVKKVQEMAEENLALRKALKSAIAQLEVINDLYLSAAPSLPRSIIKLKAALTPPTP
jgi:hypothetical protein